MGLIASDNGGAFELPPVGIFPALCVEVIDLGTQTSEFPSETKVAHQVRIGWELQGNDVLGSGASGMMANGEPFLVTEIYTLSLNERANLRGILEGWRGRPFTAEELEGFDIANLLGKPCLVDIVHAAKKNGKGNKSVVQSAKRLPAGQEPKPPVNMPTYFELADFEQHIYGGLSKWLQDKIARSPEYAAITGGTAVPKKATDGALFDDEIPF